MPDLEELFHSLERTPAPDLWEDIAEREPRRTLGPSGGRRVVVVVVALLIGASSVGLAVWALRPTDDRSRPAADPMTTIAFTSGVGGYHLAAVTLDGAVTHLTHPSGGAYDLGPTWSPSGDAIAFLRYTTGPGEDGGDYELVVADAGGRLVTHFDLTAVSFSWSPDGSRIAISSFEEGTDHDIVVAARDGTGVRVIVDSPRSDTSPAWSPEGDLIAFTSRPVLDRDPGDEHIYVVRSDGTDLTKLTGPGPHGSPAWSPNGARIAYVGARDGESEIFVMQADGSGRLALTDAPTNDVTDPVWSPDGSRIAFGVYSGTDWDVYVVDVDGTDQVPVADGPKDEVGPAWAPDGGLIAYSAAESAESCRCDNAARFDIFLVEPNGDGRRRLTIDASELGGGLAWRPPARGTD
ncbi:MAG TPA: hypothetical protein VF036_02250 [Actinomycetota bacterium]